MERQELNEILIQSLNQLLATDGILLELDLNERTITHHLANYVRQYIPANLDVDVEYNRHHDDVKRLDLPVRHTDSTDTGATTVFPDIIVHRRNSDESNVLVVEVKKFGKSLADDKRKLLAFLYQLNYKHAAHVVLGLKDDELSYEILWVEKPQVENG